MFSLTFNDGFKIENLRFNDGCFYSNNNIPRETFNADRLSRVIISDGNNEDEHRYAFLTRFEANDSGTVFAIGEYPDEKISITS